MFLYLFVNSSIHRRSFFTATLGFYVIFAAAVNAGRSALLFKLRLLGEVLAQELFGALSIVVVAVLRIVQAEKDRVIFEKLLVEFVLVDAQPE